MAMSVGLLGAGVVMGGLATRIPKGRTIVAGFIALGLALIGLAATGSLALALVLAGVVGVANVVFAVPSQTIFQQRTPANLLGRVIAIRLAMVNAMLAISMATSGLLAELFGLHAVLAACGILTLVAALAGLGFRAIRDA
jgi:MFS family permease